MMGLRGGIFAKMWHPLPLSLLLSALLLAALTPVEAAHSNFRFNPDTIQKAEYISTEYSRGSKSGIPCGTTKELKVNENVYIESPKESKHSTCRWRFLFTGCRIAISCPSFRLSDFFCVDHLEIGGVNGTKQRYCGSRGPKRFLSSEDTEVTYRTNNLFGTLGFRCRVACAPGSANSASDEDFPLPANIAPPIRCSCGLTSPDLKIVNGQETRVNEFKWMAGLVRSAGTVPFCGASLINSRYILTAAHCVTGRTPSNMEVILNEHNVLTGSETPTPMIRRSIEAIFQHRSYSNRLDYDAAIIKLRQDVEDAITNGTLLPVCLPGFEDKNTYEGQRATVAGWGVTSEGGFLSPNLRKTNVTALTDSDCRRSYPGSITPRMLCAATPSTDACQGDSGGPLIYDDQGRYTQIGIVSWGHGCARPNRPGVYSRVTEFVRWIASRTADGKYCNDDVPNEEEAPSSSEIASSNEMNETSSSQEMSMMENGM